MNSVMDHSFMEFQDVQTEYERNNRSNGMKALRCFPQCRETGHCKSGFCGTSLKSRLTINIERKSLPPGCGLDAKFWESDHVTYIAEIRESLTPGLSTERFVTRQYIESQLRTKPEKFKALIEGKPTQVQTVQSSSQSETNIVDLEFNSHCQAWHYGWQSHKYKKRTKHCIDVLVLIENGSDGYFVAGSFMSNEFEIVSTKTVQKKITYVDDGLSQAIRLSQKDKVMKNVLSSVEKLTSIETCDRRRAHDGLTSMAHPVKDSQPHAERSAKRMNFKRRKKEKNAEEEQEDEGDQDDETPSMVEDQEGDTIAFCRRSAQELLPIMFASLKREDIMEL